MLLSDSLYMSITDNGNGLADKARHKAGSFGLVGIEERITMLGGNLSIKGVPGTGTTVCVSAPIDEADRYAESDDTSYLPLEQTKLFPGSAPARAPGAALENWPS